MRWEVASRRSTWGPVDLPWPMGDSLTAIDLGTGGFRVIATATGHYHTCAILSNLTYKCWGYNPSGQLGQGNHTFFGISPSQMGDSLPPISL